MLEDDDILWRSEIEGNRLTTNVQIFFAVLLVGTKELSEKLSFLLFGDNRDDTVTGQKHDVIEGIASETVTRLQEKGLTEALCGDLEKHAYSVNDKITDSAVRNMNILITVGD